MTTLAQRPPRRAAAHSALWLGLPAAVLLLSLAAALRDGPGALALGLAAGLCSAAGAMWLVKALHRAEKGRLHLDDQLIQSQKMSSLGELSSGIAHEINTPLAVIGQEAELLLMLLAKERFKDRSDMDPVREGLEQIVTQVGRCGEITHKLLTFSRKTKAVTQEIDLSAVVDDMVRLVEREARYRNVAIERDYHEGAEPVVTDPALVRQVVLNLLNNAVQAVDHDGTVTVSTHVTPRGADIRVADTGCGIPPENLKRIYDPFFTTKPPGKGTGLGLSICMRIVQKLGGSMDVESEPGRGSLFIINLPLRHEADAG